MIPLALDELRALCPGDLHAEPWADAVSGVTIDSRRVAEGDLFVAIGRGAEFRAHALARGAAATLVPADALAALATLGRAVRERSAARVVAITGSNGKTSTKDILAALARPHARTIAAERSFNNELGVPLTLCRLEPDTEVCVLELAMRGFGQIADLAAIARPDVGVVTNVGPAHLEMVGSLEGVARAKAELVWALPPGGVAVVPAGFPVPEGVEERTFGPQGESRVLEFAAAEGGSSVVFDLRGARREVGFSFTARHQAQNALAALLAYDALGLPLDAVRCVEVEFSAWRGDELPLPGGGLLVNDAYNANPASMRAALDHLVERAAGRRLVAVLGEMAELGPGAAAFHRELGELAAARGVAVLVGVGELARGYLEGGAPVARWAPDAETAAALVGELLRPGDCVLLKGSRSVGLEAVAETLAAVDA